MKYERFFFSYQVIWPFLIIFHLWHFSECFILFQKVCLELLSRNKFCFQFAQLSHSIVPFELWITQKKMHWYKDYQKSSINHRLKKAIFYTTKKNTLEDDTKQNFCFTEILSASGPELEFRNLFDMDTVNQNANLLR